jgi:hypothetical protein
MAEYIGKKMMVGEAMGLFPKDYILMKYESDSIEERCGEILWIGTDGNEMDSKLNSLEPTGHYGIVQGSWYYENSPGASNDRKYNSQFEPLHPLKRNRKEANSS